MLGAVGSVAAGVVEAEALVLEGDAVVVGVVPLLCGEVVVTCPDLHAYTVGWAYKYSPLETEE